MLEQLSQHVSGKNILLIEDNLGHGRLIQEAFALSEIYCNIIQVRDGIEGLAFLRHEGEYQEVARPDIILLDLNLPRKDGREFLAEVKDDTDLKRIPVVVLTTSKNPDDIQQCYDLNANCYVNKSGDIMKLFDLARNIAQFWFNTVVLPVK